MPTIQKQVSHRLNKPLFGYFTPKSPEDSSALRGHFVAAAGEFVGTYLFLFTAFLGMYHSFALPDESQNQDILIIDIGHSMVSTKSHAQLPTSRHD